MELIEEMDLFIFKSAPCDLGRLVQLTSFDVTVTYWPWSIKGFGSVIIGRVGLDLNSIFVLVAEQRELR